MRAPGATDSHGAGATQDAARSERRRIYGAAFLIDAASFSFFTATAADAEGRFDVSPTGSGFLAAVTNSSIVLGCVLSARILQARPAWRLHVGALGWVALVALPLAFAAARFGILCLAGSFFGLGMGLYWPSLERQLALRSPTGALWRTLGRFNIAWGLGICLGSLGGAELYALLGVGPGLALSLACTLGGLLLLARRSDVLRRSPRARSDGAGALPRSPRAGSGGAPRAGSGSDVLPRSPRARSDGAGALPRSPRAGSGGAPRAGSAGFLRAAWVANFTAVACYHSLHYLLVHLFAVSVYGWLLTSYNLTRWLFFIYLTQSARWQYSRRWLVRLQLAAALGLLGLVLTENPLPFFLVLPLLGCFGGLSYFSSLFYGLSQSDLEARNSSLHEGILASGMVAGPLLGGLVLSASPDWPGALFLVLGTALLIALFLETRLLQQSARAATPPPDAPPLDADLSSRDAPGEGLQSEDSPGDPS